MLTMPSGASPIAGIIGIDPGSDTLGVALLKFNIETLAIVSTEAMTLRGSKMARGSWVTEIHGDRAGRIDSLRDYLYRLFLQVQPLFVASEAPFFNHLHPSAYGPLVEVITAVRDAVMQFDSWKQLYLIDPPTVKNAVGVNGRRGNKEGKELMKQAVLSLNELNYVGEVALSMLDEHSIDAIAVAYCRYCRLREELCLKG